MRIPNDPPVYRPILADALRIAWTHKQLWLFGIFAGMAGFGGATDAFIGSYDITTIGDDPGPFGTATARGLMEAFSGSPALSAVGIGFALLCVAAFAWAAPVSIAALLEGVRKITRGGEPHFADSLEDGKTHFLPVLGVTVLTRTAMLLCYAAIGGALAQFTADRTLASVGFYLVMFVAGTAVAVLASITGTYASILVVLKRRGLREAVREGMAFTRKHWLTSVEMAILLTVSAIAFTAVAILPVAMLSIPFIFAIAIASFAGATGFAKGIMLLTALILMVTVLLLAAFFATFQTAAWLLLWERLAEGRGMSKVMRVFGRRRTRE